MVEDIPDEDIPKKFTSDILDFVFYYSAGDKELAQGYVRQLQSLDYTGCLYDDDTYLNWRPTLQYDLIHELSSRSVIKFFLVTQEVGHDEDLALHRCESLMTSIKNRDHALVPIFEIAKDDIPNTSHFYGLRTLTGLYSSALKDGKKFKWLFDLSDSKKRRKSLESEQQKSLEEWKEEEIIRRRHQSLVDVEKEKKREKDLDWRIKQGSNRDRNHREKLDQSKLDEVLEKVSQIHENQSKTAEEPSETGKGHTHFHIRIEKAENSEIKIGPTYEEGRHSPPLEQSDNSFLHHPQRQFTTDGGASEASSLVSGSHTEEIVGECIVGEQENSSLEFNIPKDPNMTPERIDGAKPVKKSQKQAKEDGHSGDKEKKDQFDFKCFLADEEINEKKFSEDNLYKPTERHEATHLPVHTIDDNQNTDSRSTEVQPPSSQQAEMLTMPSESTSAPPWAPVSSSESLRKSEPNWHDHQNQAHEESINLHTLDSTDIMINIVGTGLFNGSLSNNKEDTTVPEFNDLLSEGGISLKESLNMDESYTLGKQQALTISEKHEIQKEEVLPMQMNKEIADHSSKHEGSMKLLTQNTTPAQLESTQVSMRDEAAGKAVHVSICDSEEFKKSGTGEAMSDASPYVSRAQPMISHIEGEETHPSAESNHHLLAGRPHTTGDSGIEMDEITGAQGLAMSGFQQWSANSASGLPNQNLNNQTAARNTSPTPLLAETDKSTEDFVRNYSKEMSCKDEENARKSSCPDLEVPKEVNTSSGTIITDQQHQNSPVREPVDIADAINIQDDMSKTLHTATSVNSDQECPVREDKCDLENDTDSTEGQPMVQTLSHVDMQEKLSGGLPSSTDEECIQSLEQLSDDLEQLRITGTWL